MRHGVAPIEAHRLAIQVFRPVKRVQLEMRRRCLSQPGGVTAVGLQRKFKLRDRGRQRAGTLFDHTHPETQRCLPRGIRDAGKKMFACGARGGKLAALDIQCDGIDGRLISLFGET